MLIKECPMKHIFILIFTIKILLLSFATYSSDACMDIKLINEKTLTSNDAYNLACCYALKRENKQSFLIRTASKMCQKRVTLRNRKSET